MASATLLLPERSRLAPQRLPPTLATWLGRADRTLEGGTQVARAFDVLPRGWPVAAATRQRDVGDAAHAMWLRADPVHVRPDINGARLLAFGDALSITTEDSTAFLPALKPLFGDAGFPIDAPTPTRWYLQLPRGAKLPAFTSPDDALGADLFEQLPGISDSAGSEGRRWRALLSEAQVVLHNHPRNAQRAAAGLPTINSLWFWGAGAVPDHVRMPFDRVQTDDDAMQAFAALAKVAAVHLPPRWQSVEGNSIVDLRQARDLAALANDWLLPLRADLQARRLGRVRLDFADGAQFDLAPSQRWRFWRRPLPALDA
ncbi:phosphoglycerate mutase [Lysobacter koreensis]|uniref:Phosphoglycerate mutase n=1 Tax=Lysobacter koreensis TaxID=266122 RepID=A0ABW2YIF7_9GAMM